MEIRDLVVHDLVTVGPTHTLVQAATAMNAKRVGSAIVLTDESPGIISERDVLRAVADGVDLGAVTVADYMTWNAIVATSGWDVMEAARAMQQHGIRHLLVIDGQSSSEIGILSIRDLVAGILDATPVKPGSA